MAPCTARSSARAASRSIPGASRPKSSVMRCTRPSTIVASRWCGLVTTLAMISVSCGYGTEGSRTPTTVAGCSRVPIAVALGAPPTPACPRAPLSTPSSSIPFSPSRPTCGAPRPASRWIPPTTSTSSVTRRKAPFFPSREATRRKWRVIWTRTSPSSTPLRPPRSIRLISAHAGRRPWAWLSQSMARAARL